MPPAVSNSSPLIHLSAIGRLHILRRFSSICIPPAVWREVVEEGGARPGAAEIREARNSGWISVRVPVNTDLVRLLEQDLHAGEAESIVLAIETKPDILLLDEAEARRIAGLYNISVTGIIGLLMQGKKEGHVASVQEEMDLLRNQGGFWIHDILYRRILEWEKNE
ncbi:DUF3368 domain-containing protein [Methanogenium cariaci]|jgi:uncharacterized protein|uniref:DUF3368 domain-containing protein n=1 Tax=Methanogenium cariaci TaxID=2197 RepID=UPI00155D9CE2|nr:DUF3368 domain-containing protein [Methanogenium cariaci]